MAKTELAKEPKKAVQKKVTLKAKIGEAREVILTGDFTGWAKDKIRLTKGQNGEWTGSIDLAPGEYQYRLLVDGQWRDDPTAAATVPNAFGSSNGVLKIS